LIIGIGQIDDDPMKCQLVQNFYAAQTKPNGMSTDERNKIEKQAAKIRPDSNYFQAVDNIGLVAPRDLKVTDNIITWQSSYAGNEPISHYEVLVNGKLEGKVNHKPQLLKSKPFSFQIEKEAEEILIAAVDFSGNRAEAKLG